MSVDSFQKDLNNKLSYKASSKVSSDAVLFKAFKFFDLNGVGFVPRNEFFRAMAKVGVVLDSDQEMDEIFAYYDKGKNGKIFYSDFIDEILFRNKEPSVAPSRPSTTLSNQTAERPQASQQPLENKGTSSKALQKKPSTSNQISSFIKAKVREEGVSGLVSLAVNLKSLDKDRTHHLPFARFGQVLSYLSPEQVRVFLDPFDHNKSGEANYAEVAYHLRGKQSEQTEEFLSHHFDSIDLRKEGEVAIDDLTERWRGSPKDLEDFYQAIKAYCKFQGIDDGVFTQDDFLDFYGFLQFYFDSEQAFKNYVINCESEKSVHSVQSSKQSRREFGFEGNESIYSKLSGKPPSNYDFKRSQERQQEKQVSVPHDYEDEDQRSQDFSEDEKISRKSFRSQAQSHLTNQTNSFRNIIERVKNSLVNKGTMRFLILEKALRGVDFDQDSQINLQELKKVIKDLRIGISDIEAQIIFENLDINGIGLMSYPELVFRVRGEVPESRVRLLNRIWERVKDSESHTSFTKLKSIFQPRAHPDLKIAKRHEEDILKEFVDSMLMLQDLTGVRSEEVDKDTFMEYLENVSASTPDDRFFEVAMIGLWKLSNENKIEEHYAGSRKKFDSGKNSYLQDFHKSSVAGGSSSDHAPFGTFKGPVNYTTQHRAAYES